MPLILVLSALLSTIATAGILATVGANFITLDGQALQLVAGGIGVCGALIIPGALSSGIVQSLAARGQAVRRVPILAASMLALHTLTLGGVAFALPDAQLTVISGLHTLFPPETTDEAIVIETRGPAPGTTVEVAAAQTSLASLLSGHVDGLAGLTNESAAATGVVWMRHLESQHPEGLATLVPSELYNAVYTGLKPAPNLWADPATIESTIVPRGRSFLVDVHALADSLSPRRGTGPLAWVVLPPSWIAAEARVEGPAWTGTYKRIERDKMQVTLAGTTLEMRREESQWRLELGPFGEVAPQQPDPRMMWLALLP